MEKSEPALVPQWLKNNGRSTSNSDGNSASKPARNNSFLNGNGHDFGRSSETNKTTSSYFRRSSSTNGSVHPRSYNSLNRNTNGRDWEKDTYESRGKERSVWGDHWLRDPPMNTFSSKIERESLKRSQSMVSGKGSSRENGVNKETFGRDFPSLGMEELRGASLHLGPSAKISGEKWTSALAEVHVLCKSNGIALSSVQEAGPATIAEAVAKGPSRGSTPPQLSIATQRLEELAIKQSRQLIPVTPSMPKILIPSSSDKHKRKMAHHQHATSSLPVNHSARVGPVKADNTLKPSNVGKLQILKPTREKNGTTPPMQETSSLTNGGQPNSPLPDLKPVVEKRHISQVKSRNDFFNLVRKKSVANTLENSSFSDEVAQKEVVSNPNTPRAGEACKTASLDNHTEVFANGKCLGSSHLCSEEKEIAFLRSLVWEENSEEEGLTEEEISVFFRDTVKYINSKATLERLQGVHPKYFSELKS